MSQLRKEIAAAINRASAENGSNTPDFILAEYLGDCLAAFDKAVNAREKWYGRQPEKVPYYECPEEPVKRECSKCHTTASNRWNSLGKCGPVVCDACWDKLGYLECIYCHTRFISGHCEICVKVNESECVCRKCHRKHQPAEVKCSDCGAKLDAAAGGMWHQGKRVCSDCYTKAIGPITPAGKQQ